MTLLTHTTLSTGSLRGVLVRREKRGQTLVEFALVLPILVLIVLGIMQFGLLFWAQITLTQVARDTGRWAATQTACNAATEASIQTRANQIAGSSVLFGYGGSLTAVNVSWDPNPPSSPCPPADNQGVQWVSIDITHTVPVFMPMVATSCASGCVRTLDTEVQYRMEPMP